TLFLVFFVLDSVHLDVAQLLVLLEVLLGVVEMVGDVGGQRIVQFAAGAGAGFLVGVVFERGAEVVDGAGQVVLGQAQIAALRQADRIVGVLGDQLVHLG